MDAAQQDESLMKNKRRQSRISWIRRSAANTTFALAIALLIAVVATQPAQAQTFTTLHSFDGTDGSGLYTGLVQATDGDLYGVTYFGGVNNQGTVFKITLSGTPGFW